MTGVVGMGIAFRETVAMLAPLKEDELADGNTLFNITQRLGGSIGVSILGSIVVGGATLSATIDSFHFVGVVLIAIAVVGAILALLLTSDTPDPVFLDDATGT